MGRFTAAIRRGFAVFPLPPRSKKPDAAWEHYRNNPITLDQAADLDKTDRNVAVITGTPSGIFVLDLDGPDAEQIARARGWLIPTLTVQTGRGKHLYFKLPGFQIGNKAGLAEHVDIRGEGGYVVGAGSVHPDGHLYKVIGDVEIA